MNSHYVLLDCVIRKADQGSQDDDFSYFHFFSSACNICVRVCVCVREAKYQSLSGCFCKEESTTLSDTQVSHLSSR